MRPEDSDGGWEWGVAKLLHLGDPPVAHPHRWDMTEEEARAWVKDWQERCASSKCISSKFLDPNLFVVARRWVGPWIPERSGAVR